MASREFKGQLYLIPSLLGDEASPNSLSSITVDIINDVDYFLCENEKNGRRFLKKAGINKPLDSLILKQLDKDTPLNELLSYAKELASGKKAALISDAGAPAVADPGAQFVKLCHEYKVKVTPVPGPSSILLALMTAGLNGQQFTFNGYLPVKDPERSRAIQELGKKCLQHTQIFMETPYRNLSLFDALLKSLHPETLLCIAAGLTTPSEYTFTTSVANWKSIKPPIHKVPAIFLIMRT
ncbi:MAG: SAM-dependent methyltransferase [Flavobacteriales bacterium]